MRKLLFTFLTFFAMLNSVQAMDNHHKEVRCIADNIYFEARGEDRDGWDAILTVMEARKVDKRFPSTYCGVVKQKRKNVCQFSWVCNPTLSKKTNHRKTNLYKEIYDYALTFYQAPDLFINKNIEGSLFYHNNKVQRTALGNVKLGKAVKIGNHYFYQKHEPTKAKKL